MSISLTPTAAIRPCSHRNGEMWTKQRIIWKQRQRGRDVRQRVVVVTNKLFWDNGTTEDLFRRIREDHLADGAVAGQGFDRIRIKNYQNF